MPSDEMSETLQPQTAVEKIETDLLPMEQVECPLTHRFAPGVYFREIFMPAGTIVLGHEHKTEHFNVILTGRALVAMDGEIQEVVAPAVIKSLAGVRKALLIIEDMRWCTIHPTDETDLDKLEELLIIKSPAWLAHHESRPAKRETDVEKLQAVSPAVGGTESAETNGGSICHG
jgi:hypothetical protein